MKIAISAQGRDMESPMDSRFGRAAYFVLVNLENNEWSAYDNAQNVNAAHGAGIQAACNVAKLGAGAVVTGHVGPKAFAALNAAQVEVYIGASGSVKDACEQFKAGQLKKTDEADGL